MLIGISHHYDLDESIFNFMVVGLYFSFNKNIKSNLYEQTVKNLIRAHFVASDLVLHCLPMSHKKDARFVWVRHVV